MKFGKVDNPEEIDFTLPKDHKDTKVLLENRKDQKTPLEVYVGCAKWNRTDLKGFYPRGTKDELEYYSKQFNSIELNAVFYRMFPKEQYEKWREKTPKGFKFFPKANQNISHFKRLLNTERLVDEYVHAVNGLEEKLGMVFLQMHHNFAPKDFERVESFLDYWPKHIPLAIEFRHTNWYNEPDIAQSLYALLEKHNISNIITDTAGRRDLLHMRLTSDAAFIRYVGANHESDYSRLDDWVKRLKKWKEHGLKKIYFFVHQNIEKESPLLSAYFIEQLNREIEANLKVPQGLQSNKLLF